MCLQKGPAKPKKAKEVEKAKPEEKAPEAPAENGEAKAEEEVRAMSPCGVWQYEACVCGFDVVHFVSQTPATDAAEEKNEAAE